MAEKMQKLTPLSLQQVDNEMLCEVRTEIMSISWKIFHRTCSRGDKTIIDKIVSPQLFENLQLLLGTSHSLLLRCVLESLLSFLEK
jgi:hypothetical protein